MQKRANLHFSLTLDLFGSEISTNAANAFNAGLKGRYLEDQIDDDHVLIGATYPVLRLKDGAYRARGGAGAVGAQHAAARRLRRRRASGGRALVEPHHRARRDRFPDHPAACRVQPADRRVRRDRGRPRGQHPERRGMGAPPRRVPAVGRRRRVCRQPDAPGHASPANSPPGSPRRAPASTASPAISST